MAVIWTDGLVESQPRREKITDLRRKLLAEHEDIVESIGRTGASYGENRSAAAGDGALVTVGARGQGREGRYSMRESELTRLRMIQEAIRALDLEL